MAVIWTTLEVIFLFFFFELPPVDDFIKSKHDEHLEHNQIQNSGCDNKQNEVDEKHNQDVEEESLNCDGLVSISEQENTPLLKTDCMNDIQIPETTRKSVTPPSQSFIRKAYWLLNG